MKNLDRSVRALLIIGTIIFGAIVTFHTAILIDYTVSSLNLTVFTTLFAIFAVQLSKKTKGEKGDTGIPGLPGPRGEKGDPGKDFVPQVGVKSSYAKESTEKAISIGDTPVLPSEIQFVSELEIDSSNDYWTFSVFLADGTIKIITNNSFEDANKRRKYIIDHRNSAIAP